MNVGAGVFRDPGEVFKGHVGSLRTSVLMTYALSVLLGLPWRLYQGRLGVATIEKTVLPSLAAATARLAVTWAPPSCLRRRSQVSLSLSLSATFLGLLFIITDRVLWRFRNDHVFFVTGAERTRTLVVGAGSSGGHLVDSMLDQPESGYSRSASSPPGDRSRSPTRMSRAIS